MSTAPVRRYTNPSGVRRFLWACAFLGGLAWEGLKDAVARRPPPEPFRFTKKDVTDDMPLHIERLRWVAGGSA